MAVGEFPWPEVHPIAGVRLGTASAGIKKPGRRDVALIEISEGAAVSGVFTRNAFCAEPIHICREHLSQRTPRYLLINSGNANACTGEHGRLAAMLTCQTVAQHAGIDAEEVLPFSTGVIGVTLPAQKICEALPEAFENLSETGWYDAARAIMTTDTRPKGLSMQLELGGKQVTISGIAKGSGMIKPNMGTMLGYIASDAHVAQTVLEEVVHRVVNASFNRITIDGDTSTNDALILIATGKAGNPMIDITDKEDIEALCAAYAAIAQGLAKEMVRDAEGATKCVEIRVEGGANSKECLDVAYAICHSPLVKTALFASDPNWGRIAAAIGYAGVPDLDRKTVKVWLDDDLIIEQGGCAETYTEEAGQAVFNRPEFTIHVDLGRGDAREVLWTSDLSHDYVRINAEYRS